MDWKTWGRVLLLVARPIPRLSDVVNAMIVLGGIALGGVGINFAEIGQKLKPVSVQLCLLLAVLLCLSLWALYRVQREQEEQSGTNLRLNIERYFIHTYIPPGPDFFVDIMGRLANPTDGPVAIDSIEASLVDGSVRYSSPKKVADEDRSFRTVIEVKDDGEFAGNLSAQPLSPGAFSSTYKFRWKLQADPKTFQCLSRSRHWIRLRLKTALGERDYFLRDIDWEHVKLYRVSQIDGQFF